MTSDLHLALRNGIGFVALDRPKALNSLSLAMIRDLTHALLAWRADPAVRAVVIHSHSEKAFCAGGDIRFFHQAAQSASGVHPALLEDFFSEEYALNYLVHTYPKPYLSVMDGIVMGGGMGIAQAGPQARIGIVTERTRMAMPEVHIGLFPDVGASHFLNRTPGRLGEFLGVSGETIQAADALHCGLADQFLPASTLPGFLEMLASLPENSDIRDAVRRFAEPFAGQAGASELAQRRDLIDRAFAGADPAAIYAALHADPSAFAQHVADRMRQASPLMQSVTLQALRRARGLSIADCLRMERGMMRRAFEQGEVVEGIRARVIDKDNAPRWRFASIDKVDPESAALFFEPPWPDYAHPLRDLR